MPYNRQIPDAPIAGSMLPRATELTLDDILVLIQPGNPIGQKNKALTLQVLAAFLGDKFNSIVLQGSDGKSLTITGNGTTFAKPHTSQSDMRDYTIVESGDGITLQVTVPTGTQKVVLGYTTSEISSTANGLTQKLTLGQSGITISNQARVNGQVVTTEKQIARDHIDTQELEFFNTNFPKQGWKLGIANSPDANMKELVLLFTGTEAAKRFVVRAETLFTQPVKFEKDVTINANLNIGGTKTLNVGGDAGVTGNLNVIGKVTMGQMVAGSLVIAITDSASVAAAEQTISEMENGRAFIILNTSTSALSFNFSGGAVVSITAKKGVWGIKVGDSSYPIDT